MAQDNSFDIVSKVDIQEVRNAIDQAMKEIRQRFDLKDSHSDIKLEGSDAIQMSSASEYKLEAVKEILGQKLVKRGVSLKTLDTGDPKLSGKEYRMGVALKEGITQDNAKKISKIIRDEGPKGVRAQVQGEELRVSAKKKDDLQAVIALLKGKEFDFALQFVNYR